MISRDEARLLHVLKGLQEARLAQHDQNKAGHILDDQCWAISNCCAFAISEPGYEHHKAVTNSTCWDPNAVWTPVQLGRITQSELEVHPRRLRTSASTCMWQLHAWL